MKRILLTLGMLLASATMAMAAGTVTVALDDNSGNDLRVIAFTATADASDGSYPSTSTGFAIDGFLCRVIVDPDNSATPTDNYDATLTDQYGVDVMEGAMANLDTTAVVATDLVPTVNSGAATGCVLVRGPLTLALSGNSVNSAITVIRLLVLQGN